MTKKILITLTLIASSFGVITAQDTDEKKIEYAVGLDFGTTYLWRGYDVFQAAANSGSVFNWAPAIFPTVTLTPKDSGFSFNVWSSFALSERSASESGLEGADEIDLTAAYAIEDKSGTFSAAFVAYIYPSTSALPTYPELILSYTAPIVLSPTFGVASALGSAGTNSEYAFFKISHDIELGNLSISPALLLGAWLYNGKSSSTMGHLDLTVPVGYQITESVEAHLAIIGSYRLAGYDENGSDFILVAVLGASGSF